MRRPNSEPRQWYSRISLSNWCVSILIYPSGVIGTLTVIVQFIILLLEGLKSILNILTLGNSLEYFGGLITSPYDPTSPGVIDAFKKIGIDVTELNGKIDALTGMVTPEVFNFDDPAISEAGITPEIFQTNERTTRNLAAAVLQLFRVCSFGWNVNTMLTGFG